MASNVAALQMDEIGVRRTTFKVTVPNNDIAYLMYYLRCVCSVIAFPDDHVIRKYTAFEKWNSLTNNEKKELLKICKLVSPDLLKDKVFFQIEELCVEYPNEFYEIDENRNVIVATEAVVVHGRQHKVTKVMVYKPIWMKTYYTDPMRTLNLQLNNINIFQTHYTPSRSISSTKNVPISTQPVEIKSSRSNKWCWICCVIFFIIIVISISSAASSR